MGAPAGHTRDGEQRREQLLRQAEHLIQKAAVEVDVRGGGAAVAGREHLARDALDDQAQLHLVAEPFLAGDVDGELAQHLGARVGEGVDRVADAVDQAAAVEGALGEGILEIAADLRLARPVADVRLQVVDHLHDLDVRAAVARPLQRAERGRDGGIGVRPGRGDDVVCKGGVVAAVVGVEDERRVERTGLQLGILLVGAQEVQDVLRHRQLRIGDVQVEVMPLPRAVGLVAVDGQLRRVRNQLQTLAQGVRQADVIGGVIVAVERQNGAGERVHHVAGRDLHDDVAHEAARQAAVIVQQTAELLELCRGRQFAEEQQVNRLLKAEALVPERAIHQLAHVVPAVVQHALTGDGVVAVNGVALDLGDASQARQHAAAVGIAQAALDVIFLI